MSQSFSSNFFKGNRRKLLNIIGNNDLLVLTGNGLLQKNADEPHSFKQDGNFWYITGVTIAESIYVNCKNEEFIILPKRSDYLNIFDGTFNTNEVSKVSGVKQVLDHEEGWQKLEEIVKKQKVINTLSPPPEFIDVYGFYVNPAKSNLFIRLRQINQEFEAKDINVVLRNMRMVKQKEELAAIRKAIEVTGNAIDKVKSNLVNLKYEYEIEALITYEFRKNGATGHSFSPIVSSGKNATILHHNSNNGELNTNELIQLDIGAEVDNYAADISRVISINEPNKRQKQIYDAVLEVQNYAIGLVRPGLIKKDLEISVHKFMGQKLIELGLIKQNIPDEVYKYYPHAVSHFMGYDVHDFGNYDNPLETGVVLTIEPGIYIPEEQIGIRIEDDILVSESGNENMSSKITRVLY